MSGTVGISRGRARDALALGTVLAGLLLAEPPRALSLDPDRRISQYAHTAWRVRDGAFAGAPNAITQTTDGYIWIGTHAELLRFDGVRFIPFTPPAGKRLPSPAVISLLGATDGSLWIGTASGLAQWKNGDLINFPETAGRVNSIYEDREGTIWMARTRTQAGGVCKVEASVAKCYGPRDGVPRIAATLIGDNLGNLWIGTPTSLIRWKLGSSVSYDLAGLKSSVGLNGVNALVGGGDGSVWVGINQSRRGLGLQQWVNGAWKTLITPTLDSSTLNVNGLLLDQHNALWVATAGTGIYRVHDGKVDHFLGADGLSGDSGGSFFEDREGNLWLTTPDGIDCFRDIPVVNLSVREGLTSDDACSVFAARDGTVWIGNLGGLDYVRGNVVSAITPKNGLPGNSVTSLFEDHAGRLWVGLDNGLFVYEGGRFRSVQRPDGGFMGIVVAMTEDAQNDVWAAVIREPTGRPTKLVQIRNGRVVSELSDPRLDTNSLAADPQDGLWLGLRKGGLARYQGGRVQVLQLKNTDSNVNQVLANADGSVLAASNDGLFELRGENQHTLNDQNGLPCDRVYGMVTDKHSNLWLYAQCGLIAIKSEDLQAWREHPEGKVKFDLFDAYDGAQPFSTPFRPVATRSNDGRLWFANENVVQMVEPDRLSRNSLPAPVHIEEVVADRKNYSPRDGLRLPALTGDLEIDYTALSFVVPQKVQFRYKLEGYDRNWEEPKTRRQAFYSNLRPGNYRFRVMASNNAGAWNEQGAALDFSIAAAYYQTTWFRALCVAVFVALLWALHRLRLRQQAQQFNMRLEERVGERSRIARELHDTLLQSFQALLLSFQSVINILPQRPQEARERLVGAVDQAQQAITEGRDAVQALRSSTIATNDLAAALKALAAELAANQGGENPLVFDLQLEGASRDLHPIMRDDVFRIATEALRNAFQHAQASRIEAEIHYDDHQLRLRVRDDGRGIDSQVMKDKARPGHWGLRGMQERAKLVGGELEVWSKPDSGTEIELRIPARSAYAALERRSWFSRREPSSEETK